MGLGRRSRFAELQLAKAIGCQTVLIHTGADRGEIIKSAGIKPLDRAAFPSLTERYSPTDRKGFAEYLKSERSFLNQVDAITKGARVSIFIDNIGGPVARATLRALGRQGVIATSGWKLGSGIEFNRAVECIERHLFVHTHASPLREGLDAMNYAIQTGWLPPEPEKIYFWEDIPHMVEQYGSGRIASYFPTFATAAARFV